MGSEAEAALRAPRTADQSALVLENVLEEIERLSRLSDQLLFLCREDAGLVPLARAAVPFDELLRDVSDHMRAVAQAKGVSLSLDRVTASRLAGDEDHLRRLLFNLLDNAIKFTPSGGS